MKKFLAIVLSIALALGLSASAFAKGSSDKLEKLKSIAKEYNSEDGPSSVSELLGLFGGDDPSPSDNALDFYDRLLEIELYDDESYDDYLTALALICYGNSGEEQTPAFKEALLVLSILDYIDEGDEDISLLEELFTVLFEENELEQLKDELSVLLAPFKDVSHNDFDKWFAHQLYLELTDNDSLYDVEAMLQFLRLVSEGGYESGYESSLINVLGAIAVADALDDDSYEDYESMLSFIQAEYDSYGMDSHKTIAQIESALTTITDENYTEMDEMIPELLYREITDNLNIDDFDLLWRIIELYGSDDATGADIRELLKNLALIDYYDDYSDDDFYRLITHVRLGDKEDGGTKYNDTADEALHLAWVLNPQGFESEPLAK